MSIIIILINSLFKENMEVTMIDESPCTYMMKTPGHNRFKIILINSILVIIIKYYSNKI